MCGILGILCTDYSYSVAGLIYHGLMALQHRGQKFTGIATTNCNGKIITHKEKGLVSKVLNPNVLKSLSGNVGIGHACFGGKNIFALEHVDPYYINTDQANFTLIFNGTLLNYHEIRSNLEKMGKIFVSDTDVELVATLIETFLKFSDNMTETLKTIAEMLDGSYCLLLMEADGTLYAMRDIIGNKPLCYGTLELYHKFFYVVASESVALDAIGGKFEADIKPGEILKFNIIEGLKRYQINKPKNVISKICQFEYTYFSRPDSIIEGVPVANVRYNLGRNLAKYDDVSKDNAIVVPVPDSGRLAAMGYAFESKILYQEGLMKNRYIWEPKREVEQKLNPLKTIVRDKNIILIDDSIISGNTMKKIIKMLKKVGAKSIHVRIATPPIINWCELNANFSNRSKLIAYQKKIVNYDNFNEEMRQYIGADSLKYQTIEGLINSIGLPKENICLDCLKEYCTIRDKNNLKNLELIL